MTGNLTSDFSLSGKISNQLSPNFGVLFIPAYPHVNVGLPICQLLPCLPCLPPCCMVLPPWLPISIPPTSLDECFFVSSLVVRLPYSSIFWQFFLFFVFKFVVVLLLVVQRGKMYLTVSPSCLEVSFLYLFKVTGKTLSILPHKMLAYILPAIQYL